MGKIWEALFMIEDYIARDEIQQDEITRREHRYRAMFETAMVGMVMSRPDDTLLDCNRAFLEILGYSADEIEHLNLADYLTLADIAPQKQAPYQAERQRALQTQGRFGPYEKEYLAKNGAARPLLAQDVLVKGAGGKDYICSIVSDITRTKQLESQFSLISQSVDNAFDSFSIADERGQFVYVNKAHVELFGYDSADEVIGLSPTTHCADPAMAGRFIQQAIKNGHCQAEFKARRKDGSLFCALIHVKLGHDLEGRPIYIGSLIDISARKQAEAEMRILQRAVEASSSAVIITDKNGRIEYVNPKFTRITGYEKSEALGKQPVRLLLTDKASRGKARYGMWHAIANKGEWSGVFRNNRKDGSLYWGKNTISSVKDSKGRVTHYISIHEDISEHYELSEKLNYQATHDSLTGLINRREFERRAQKVVTASAQEARHALCYMDLDQFKIINDTCGHVAGDELLRQIGMLLKKTVRKRDTVARLGGDEFAVLMEDCPPKNALHVANSLLEAVRDFQFGWKGYNFRLGISIGIVGIDSAVRSMTQIFRDADLACYTAKEHGRNQIHFYHEKDADIIERHGEMQWVSRINQALEEGRFCLYAQPILGLNNPHKHYELLLRMLDEQGEIIPPGAFLPAAERYDMIVKLDHWIIKHAFSLLAQHPTLTRDSTMYAINLSGPSLATPVTLELILELLKQYKLDSRNICFEVTETSAISNLSAALRFMTKLKGLGCRFSLDDFGAGLSSFAYLKNLPVNYLKIDGMFIKGIASKPVDFAMVKSINEIGQVMGMQTIAEFVENEAITARLEEIGVNYAQGYAIGKPAPLTELIEA